MNKWVFVLSIVGVVVVSGCVDSIVCKPDWVLGYEQAVSEYVPQMTEENCKAACYSAVETTKFKIERNVPKEFAGQTMYFDKCYCDINNCNPKMTTSTSTTTATTQSKPITTWNYRGIELTFRSDLREANKVPAYPGETQIYLDTMHQLVKNVTIAFKDTREYGHYATEAFEITYKMKLAYMSLVGSEEGSTSEVPGFNAETVKEYANLPGKIQNPIIALVPPEYANETAVRNEGHVTYISGKTWDELDLATTKFLMIVLGIELEA